jgi:hypothetical protein
LNGTAGLADTTRGLGIGLGGFGSLAIAMRCGRRIKGRGWWWCAMGDRVELHADADAKELLCAPTDRPGRVIASCVGCHATRSEPHKWS